MKSNFLPCPKKIKDFIEKSQFKNLLLAVSGGIDSICLAHYFIKNKKILGIEKLIIAHVNHGLRDKNADCDAKFVEHFAKAQKVPFFLKNLDGKSLKNKEGSLEKNARDARYDALYKIAIQNNIHAIITAHHASDQAETIYLRLRRGVTLAGLQGIQQTRDINLCNHQNNIQLYRPFLNVSRQEIHQYAITNNLTWCEDESNTDTKFARNQIRHILLPKLEDIYPSASHKLCGLAQIANKAYNKTIAKANTLFSDTIVSPKDWPFDAKISPYKKVLALDENKLQNIFSSFSKKINKEFHSNSFSVDNQIQGLHEIFRLWLDSLGFRFPTKSIFFKKNQKQFSTHTTIDSQDYCLEHNYHYRTRFIEKCRHIIWIYDIHDNQTISNLYFSTEKQRFSGIQGIWRHPQIGDILNPMDMKIKARKLSTWLQEKSIPRWMRQFLYVYAQDYKVLFVSGIRNNI